MRNRAVVVAALLAVTATGCYYRARRRGYYYGSSAYAASYGASAYNAPTYGYAAQQPTAVVAQPAAAQTIYADQGQPLYLPSTNFDLNSIQAAVIRTNDGRQLTLTPADIQAVSQGRVALNIPTGITAGTITVYANGQQFSVPFQVRITAGASGPPVITVPEQGAVATPAQPVAAADPNCAALAGTWAGTMRGNDPNVNATLALTMGSDCRTVQGTLYWRSAISGSNDRSVTGTFDPSNRTLVMHDVQVANAATGGGWQFCRIDQYVLTLGADNAGLSGYYSSAQCRDRAQVALRRAQ